jgi:hypothetical protein
VQLEPEFTLDPCEQEEGLAAFETDGAEQGAPMQV